MPKKQRGEESVVRVSKGIDESIEEFLKTPQSRRLGLDSKKEVVNMAVLEFLAKQEVKLAEAQYKQLIEFFNKNPELLKNMGFDSVGQLVQRMLRETSNTKSSSKKREVEAENTI